ncbi:quinoprotein glucose dehydrogenase [Sphingomonas sp. LH128]|uniref:membrane-bound PQQ-dependent dehydrogenase, glucose/quinate/shikimate family n=1 Tax=Sphingomonas sp. LH128 TaxID=473781 RepID=UPI00027CBC4F|nr:membrane-bound PQQ-dependent dehydrogenase, glucose/quinate/shikimate family [Sphingomonas sp. LH128]EJU12597.1 quinoprotein glucose dehydrogenase [Sphingomonas sp. LH128]
MTGLLKSKAGQWYRKFYAGLLIVIALVLVAGGVVLLMNAGSAYYLLAGLAVLASGVFILRSDATGIAMYCVMLCATLAWSLWEVGFDTWGLVPRLVAPIILGFGLLPSPIRKLKMRWVSVPARRGYPAIAAGTTAALVVGTILHAAGSDLPVDPLWHTGAQIALPTAAIDRPTDSANSEWRAYGNDQGGTRFSPLDQINAGNVGALKVAWTADTGAAPAGASTGGLEVTPIMVGDSLYICNGYDAVIAYDAETGKRRWHFAMSNSASGKPWRGVTYYRVPGATGACAERIYASSQVPDLVALDARTGRPCTGFGRNGRASLRAGVSPAPFGLYYVSSAPQLIRGKLVIGGSVLDNQFWGAPSGVVRAFDAVTGKLSWAFDVGHPDRLTAPPQGQVYTPSTPNSWAPMTADERLGIVYLPMGNSTPDLYGAQRRPFDDSNSSSIIAVDVETGRPRWRFQATHHDLWDYDMPSQPTLADVPTANGLRAALIAPTKRGEIFVLDRATGRPIKTVRELPVPQGGNGPGDRLSPTQPFSVGMPSLRGPDLREASMWGITPIDQMLCRIQFKRARYEGTLTPIGLDRPTIVQPGYGGGVNWGSISVDTDCGIMIVPWMNLPTKSQLLTRAQAHDRSLKVQPIRGPVNTGNPMANTPYGAANGPFISPLGVPCTSPAYASMTAIDLATGRVIWTKPFGTARDTGPLGIAWHLPATMGVPFSGGGITTRGGLVFIAASVEQAIRAYDVGTGEELWKARLPAGGQATPMTYRGPRSGRQLVVIAAGGKPSLKTKQGTSLVAYALPR